MLPMSVAPPPTEDHPDLYISEEVKHFLPYFEYQIAEKVVQPLSLSLSFLQFSFPYSIPPFIPSFLPPFVPPSLHHALPSPCSPSLPPSLPLSLRTLERYLLFMTVNSIGCQIASSRSFHGLRQQEWPSLCERVSREREREREREEWREDKTVKGGRERDVIFPMQMRCSSSCTVSYATDTFMPSTR